MSIITLNYQTMGPVVWGDAASCDFKPGIKVDLWRINTAAHLSHINYLLKVLNPAEKMRAARYHKSSDRDQFIISRGTLRYILARYLNQSAASIQFELMANKKPYVLQKSGDQVHFNLSDSNGLVLVAIANSAVGIDVEHVKPGFDYQAIAYDHFSAHEYDFISDDESLEHFFVLWTRKEAILKATGKGLTDQLKLIPSLDGRHQLDGELVSTRSNWQLSSFMPIEKYIATIAVHPQVESYDFWDVDFDHIT